MRAFLEDKRNVVILLLSILFFIKAPQEGKKFIFWVVYGVSTCVILDLLIHNLFIKEKPFPKSAVITGFILSAVLDYNQPLFLLAIFSILAIASKYILKFKNRHIFNPANFGLFLAVLFKLPLAWKIEANIPLIIIVGIFLAYSFRKIVHVLGFLIFFVPLASLVLKASPFSLISWFFIFIMLIEPKTSGYGALRGFVFGSIAGISAILLFKFLPGFDPFVTSLFIANLFNPLLAKLRSS